MGVLSGVFFEKYELMLHWDLYWMESLPGVDFTILRDHQNIIEGQCKWNFFPVENTLVNLVLRFEVGNSLFNL